MNISDRVYTNTDQEYQAICEFLNTLSTQDPFMLWDSGRMNFWRYNVHANKDPQDRFFKDNVHVWRTADDEIVGLCLSETGENDLFIEVHPAYHAIYPDIFRWIENTWAVTRPAIEIDVYSNDSSKLSRLKAEGFSFLHHFENERLYALEQMELAYQLEEGFSIQTFSESLDYAGRVALVQSAFDNPDYTEQNLRGLMSSRDYIDEYNLMVISPDKQPVAYCVGWHEPGQAQHGYIEPVGTHAAYRQRGFAQAVIKECFKRMQANGIKTVEIASRAEPAISNFLYDSMSPQSTRQIHKYRKLTA